ncbi:MULTISPECIES: cation transporter [Microbacterium]|uniref:Cation efflux family protein n=1 Tax=Microbacterium saccharophilum TaxID=1213358 RepID=A0A7Z7CYM1_9MICO|nr:MULTISPECIES: cation transporter [Microbacterium]SFI20156.1 Cation efflux family protein [Microbacterium saccharophilum]
MQTLRRVVLTVALLNLAYFSVEFAVAIAIGSVSLFADSVDFLEDALINLLIFAALPWSAARRRTVGSVLAFVILIPAVATVWAAVAKAFDPYPPAPLPLTLTAAGALIVNLTAALLLVRHRHHSGSLTKAAWLSARNDAFANVAIIAVGILTIWFATGWLDIIAGVAIGILNADAARAVWNAARREVDPAP